MWYTPFLSAINAIVELPDQSGDMHHSIMFNQNPASGVSDIASDGWINKQPDGDQFSVQDRKGHLPTDTKRNVHRHSEPYSSE